MYFHRSITLFVFFLFSCFQVYSQDSLAYEVQRQRVNELLDQRSARFGQFNQSLEARTGIFGLKTKKDMQASIDILREIVQTDNHIFKETKVLLDYKDMEKTFISYQAEENKDRINGYVNTISKLQKHQESQTLQIEELENQSSRYLTLLIFCLILVIILTVLLYKLKFRSKTKGIQ
ncbi:hypothetical protein [Albibacterium indicum]|uniref:hypothetical protein n=1 Tax=Albibacterium indicum TaxID=2292082 RepID=UPI000E4B1DA8|nr:hypothetical protein [Pedobacter indicus]